MRILNFKVYMFLNCGYNNEMLLSSLGKGLVS